MLATLLPIEHFTFCNRSIRPDLAIVAYIQQPAPDQTDRDSNWQGRYLPKVATSSSRAHPDDRTTTNPELSSIIDSDRSDDRFGISTSRLQSLENRTYLWCILDRDR